MPCPVGVLLAEVPYLVCRGHPDVLTRTRRKFVNHALEFRLSQPDEHTLQRVLRVPGFPPLVYLPFLIVHRAPLVGGGDTQALSLRAQLLRTLQRVEKGLAGRQVHPLRCSRTPWKPEQPAPGRRRAAACAALLGPFAPKATSRFTFCPEAIIRASALTFSSPLSLNLRKPCHSLASANSGSTHTARFLSALR